MCLKFRFSILYTINIEKSENFISIPTLALGIEAKDAI